MSVETDHKMLTHVINMTGATAALPRRRDVTERAAQQVVIVNGGKEILDLFDNLLEAGRYDVVFVETSAHAYSQIRRVQPDLVILCLNMEDPAGFSVLSMLKLDAETQAIPVLTCMVESGPDDEDESSDEDDEMSANDIFMSRAMLRMN